MKAAIIFGIIGVYLVLAFAIARFCAVNAGWERIADLFPKNGGDDFAEPEPKKLSGPGTIHRPGDSKTQEA